MDPDFTGFWLEPLNSIDAILDFAYLYNLDTNERIKATKSSERLPKKIDSVDATVIINQAIRAYSSFISSDEVLAALLDEKRIGGPQSMDGIQHILSAEQFVDVFRETRALRHISTMGIKNPNQYIYTILANAAYSLGSGDKELAYLFRAIVEKHNHEGDLSHIFGAKFPDMGIGKVPERHSNPQNNEISAMQIAFSLLNSQNHKARAQGFNEEAYTLVNKYLDGTGFLLSVDYHGERDLFDTLELVSIESKISKTSSKSASYSHQKGPNPKDLADAILADAARTAEHEIDHRWIGFSPELGSEYESIIPLVIQNLLNRGYEINSIDPVTGHKAMVRSYTGKIRTGGQRRVISYNKVIDEVCDLIWFEIFNKEYVSSIEYRSLDKEEANGVKEKMLTDYGIILHSISLSPGTTGRGKKTLALDWEYATEGTVADSANAYYHAFKKILDEDYRNYNRVLHVDEVLSEAIIKHLSVMFKQEEILCNITSNKGKTEFVFTPTGKRAKEMPDYAEPDYPISDDGVGLDSTIANYKRMEKSFSSFNWSGTDNYKTELAVQKLEAKYANHFYKEYIVGRKLLGYVIDNFGNSGNAAPLRALIEDAIDKGMQIFNEESHPGALKYLIQLRDNATCTGSDWKFSIKYNLREISEDFFPPYDTLK